MQGKYNDIADYFESLAKSHRRIKEYYRYELDELLDHTANIKKFPALVLEGFDFDYSGSVPDHVLKNRNGAFCLVEKCDLTNAKLRTDTLEALETIAEQILVRMVTDKRNRHPLLTCFEISSAEGAHFANPALGLVLCRVSFSFKTQIKEDISVWQ